MMAVKNKFSDYFHFQHRLANGEIRDVEVYSSPVEIHGKIMLYAIIHDITDRKHIEEAIEHRLLMEEIISIISNRFINVRSENIHIEIKAALQALAEFVRVERSYVSFLSDDERTVQQIYEWHQNNVTFGSELFEDKSFEWIMEKLRRFETICLFDAANTESEAANIEKNIRLAQSFKSLLIIPLILKKKLIGFLGFNSEYKEKVWTDEDISLLRLVGEIIVNARMRKQADEELRASEKFLSIQIKN